MWIPSADEEAPKKVELVERAKKALDAAGIEIPFPHLQLFVDDVRPPVWRDAKALLAGREDD